MNKTLKKLAVFSLLSLAIVPAFAQSVDSVKLSGVDVNRRSGKVYLQKFENKNFITIDSAVLNAGKFQFKSKIELPELYSLSSDLSQTPFYIFLDHGNIEVQLDSAKNYSQTAVKGAILQDEFQAFKKLQEVDISSYIKSHPSSLVTAYILYRNYAYRLTPEQIRENIALLAPQVHQSTYVKELHELIKVWDAVAIGKKAPDFEVNDQNGKPVKLSDHYSKYTLIDFWASWCVPCRKENPNVVAAYEKFKDKGFAVFGVSLDKNKASWLKGIKDDGLNWLQVSELSYWNSTVAKQYGVRAIPANFLIDENGIIVGKNLRGAALHQKLTELLHN